jgi:hypothetical protein
LIGDSTSRSSKRNSLQSRDKAENIKSERDKERWENVCGLPGGGGGAQSRSESEASSSLSAEIHRNAFLLFIDFRAACIEIRNCARAEETFSVFG